MKVYFTNVKKIEYTDDIMKQGLCFRQYKLGRAGRVCQRSQSGAEDDGRRVFDRFVTERYSSYAAGIGKEISEGKADFKSLETYVLDLKEIENSSESIWSCLTNIS